MHIKLISNSSLLDYIIFKTECQYFSMNNSQCFPYIVIISFSLTMPPLPHTRPTLCVSLRNCCHRGNITTRTKQPNSAKTVRPAQHVQSAPLSHIPRFTPLSLTSTPRTQHGTSRFKQCLALFCGLMERLLLWVRIGEYVSIPFIGFCDANNKLTL